LKRKEEEKDIKYINSLATNNFYSFEKMMNFKKQLLIGDIAERNFKALHLAF